MSILQIILPKPPKPVILQSQETHGGWHTDSAETNWLPVSGEGQWNPPSLPQQERAREGGRW